MAKKQTYWTHLNPTAPTTFSLLEGSVDHRWSANFHDVKPRRDPAPERACRMTAAATRHKGELANSDTPSFAAQTQRIGKDSWLKNVTQCYTLFFEFFSSLKWVWEWFYGNTSTCSWTKVAQPIGVKLAYNCVKPTLHRNFGARNDMKWCRKALSCVNRRDAWLSR